MDERLNPLFTPWKIGNCEIKNRIVLTSMGGTNLLGWMENNHFDKDGAKFILEVAKNNAGLVLPGCQPVYNPMFGQWLHKKKKMYEDLKAWMPERLNSWVQTRRQYTKRSSSCWKTRRSTRR